MSDAYGLNRQVRALLAKSDLKHPGTKAHAEQVAVYAVATAERLGLSDEDLLAVRLTAELQGIGKLPKELVDRVQFSGPIADIVRLCDRFARGQAVGGQGLSWLQYEAFHHFDHRDVAALRAVEPLITPSV